jgi:elongation factor G
MSHTTHSIRNVALAGHPAAGKTTLFEALLQAGGTIQTAGTIERGSTLSDFDPIEKQRGHSLDAAIASIDHGTSSGAPVHINLVDTPGYPDFRGPALAALAAVDTVVVVVGRCGAEYGARRMMDYAKARNLCRVIVVNKIDHADADYARVLDELRDAFGPECLPLNLPAQGGKQVIDCFWQAGSSGADASSDLGAVADWHQKIIDQVVEVNETVMEHYLDLGEDGLSARNCTPRSSSACARATWCRCCSARRAPAPVSGNCWISPPSCSRTPPRPTRLVLKGEGSVATAARGPDPAAHVIADVFKIVNDPFVGKLGVFRVYQGTVKRDTQLFIDDGKKPFKVGHLFKVQGRDHVEIDQAIPGDIAAVARIDELHFDAVLHDSHDEDHIHLAPLDFPAPMFGLAVEAVSKGQEQKLATALHKLAEKTVPSSSTRPRPTRRCCAACRTCTCGEPRAPQTSTVSRSARPPRIRSARRSWRRPRATRATRSRPAGPASSARCTCASSRSRAGPGSSSPTSRRAA